MPFPESPAALTAGSKPRTRKLKYESGRVGLSFAWKTQSSSSASAGMTFASSSTNSFERGTMRTPATVFGGPSVPSRRNECRTCKRRADRLIERARRGGPFLPAWCRLGVVDLDVPSAKRVAAGVVPGVECDPVGVTAAGAVGIAHLDPEQVIPGAVDRCIAVDVGAFKVAAARDCLDVDRVHVQRGGLVGVLLLAVRHASVVGEGVAAEADLVAVISGHPAALGDVDRAERVADGQHPLFCRRPARRSAVGACAARDGVMRW